EPPKDFPKASDCMPVLTRLLGSARFLIAAEPQRNPSLANRLQAPRVPGNCRKAPNRREHEHRDPQEEGRISGSESAQSFLLGRNPRRWRAELRRNRSADLCRM
ncbi:unnamed protein product, partial [Effrenium voratum]